MDDDGSEHDLYFECNSKHHADALCRDFFSTLMSKKALQTFDPLVEVVFL